MVVRVYDARQIPCSCVLEDSDWGLMSLDVHHISANGGLLNTTVLFPRGSVYEAIVKLTAGPSTVLNAQVVSSGDDGLRVRWRHDSRESAEEFGRMLEESALDPRIEAIRDRSGQLDINRTLLNRTRTVDAQDLAARNRTVRVVQMSSVMALIKEAVDDAITRLGRDIDERDKARLLAEAEEIFAQRLEVLKAEKADLETRDKKLTEELTRAKDLLEEERSREIEASRFTVSDKGMLELETRLGRLIEKSVKKGAVTPSLEDDMRAIMVRLLDHERAKIRENLLAAQSEGITLLERKVERLARSLEETVRERDRAQQRAAQLEANSSGTVRNVVAPGLIDGDPDRDLKLELLQSIVQENHELRDHMARKGYRLRSRKNPEGEGSVRKIPTTPNPGSSAGSPSAVTTVDPDTAL